MNALFKMTCVPDEVKAKVLVVMLLCGMLPDELINLTDTISKNYLDKLVADDSAMSDLANLIRIVQGCNMDPEVRLGIIELATEEINVAIRLWALEKEAAG